MNRKAFVRVDRAERNTTKIAWRTIDRDKTEDNTQENQVTPPRRALRLVRTQRAQVDAPKDQSDLPGEDQVVAEQNPGAYREVEDSRATRQARSRTVGSMTAG
ncbi:hypothetical protein E2986_13065 [Frieseomelitta varia]|uniref:Uncharacterized protein n=1 Tax=Frieseomelitta varia TaxID=561572 RepID=A0A833RZI1_9HYME|nr:hypothetical protein E2986_13065 [Frieseomelitta varia]